MSVIKVELTRFVIGAQKAELSINETNYMRIMRKILMQTKFVNVRNYISRNILF